MMMNEQDVLETPAISPQPTKTKKKPLLIALGLLIVLSGTVFAGIQIGKKQKPQTPSEILFNQPTIQATPANDQTKGWNTFGGENLGFSFKYPLSYFASSDTDNPVSVSSPLNINRGKSFELQNGELKVEIYIEKSRENDSSEKCFFEHNAGGAEIISQDKTLIAGIEGARYTWSGGGGSGETVCIINNGKRYLIGKYPLETTRQEEFDQILATFKFLDSNQMDATVGWKTYGNTKYGFEFKYPLDFILNIKPENIISKKDEDLHIIREQIAPFSTENKMFLLINIWDNPQELSAIDWLKWHEEEYQKRGFLPSYKENTIFEANSFVDELLAYKDIREIQESKKSVAPGGSAFPRIDYYVAQNNKLYAIELNNYTPEAFGDKNEVIYDLFDQILSTFKFLD